jgi:hypothetical protein
VRFVRLGIGLQNVPAPLSTGLRSIGARAANPRERS